VTLSRRFSDWKGETRSPRDLLPLLEAAIARDNFAEDIDSQMWVAGCFAKFHWSQPKEFAEVQEKFCERTGLANARLIHLLQMPGDPNDKENLRDPAEVMANMRSSLKATRTEVGPPLPGEEIYPRTGFLGQYLNYTQETTAPLAYHFWLGVALLGAACRRNVYMECGYRLYPNQYLFFVGETAEGKGLAFGRATPLVWRANEIFEEVMMKQEVGVGPLADGSYPRRVIEVLGDKPTPQALVSALIPKDQAIGKGVLLSGLDSVGWLASEEVSSWLGRRDNIYEGCVNIITAFYNCLEAWSANTQARGVEKLKNMCLTVLCGSNMEWINKSITPDMFAGGFIRRCMFINRERSERRQYTDSFMPPRDPLQAEVLAHQMVAWMMAKESVEVELSRGAMEVYGRFTKKWIANYDEPPDPNLTYYYLGKYNFVLKLAMVLVVSRHTLPDLTCEGIHKNWVSLTMQASDLEKAIELVEFEEPYLKDCFTKIGEHRHMAECRKLLSILTNHNINYREPMLRNQFTKAAKTKVGDYWKPRLEGLIDCGDVKMTRYSARKQGRPGEWLWVPGALDWDPVDWVVREGGSDEQGN
jgi:hypothetical protein